MKQRVITAIVLIAVFVPCIIFGGILFDIAAYFLMTVACHECLNLFKEDWSTSKKIPVYLLFILGCSCGLFKFEYYVPVACLMLIYLFFLVVQFEKVKFDQVGIVFLVFNLLTFTVAAIQNMYAIDKILILYLLIGTFLTDTMALFCGKAFGKHKLNERISPKKTIEGSVGAYIITAIVSLVFGFVVLKQLPVTFIIATSLIFPAAGQLGDLAFSAIKRYFKIKDFGNIFPGHGGVLDRIDSLTFNAMLAYCLMIILL